VEKEAVLAEDIIAMVVTLDRGTLRGLRYRAMLLIVYAGGFRRSTIVGRRLPGHGDRELDQVPEASSRPLSCRATGQAGRSDPIGYNICSKSEQAY
jgi:site-specific recombinase XerD